MPRDISDLEPAERDPAQLRKTGLIIAAVMILGGVLVMAAYLIKTQLDGKDDRPHIVGRLEEVFGGRDHHGKAFSTSMLKGKITLLMAVDGEEEEHLQESFRMMKAVADKYPDDDLYRFVGITVNPENDGSEELKAMLEKLGVADDPRWIFVQAEEKNARGYLRDNLRLGTERSIGKDGKEVKVFDSIIVFIGPKLHVFEPSYNFQYAKEVQEDAIHLLEKDPEKAERLNAKNHTEDLKAAEESFFQKLEYIREGKIKEG